MPEESAIRCEGLGKRYRRVRGRGLNHLLGRLWRTSRSKERDLWALRGVSFELARGEALGVVGPNGSGKSTLLKLLAGVSAPTEGRFEIKGRVAALLELGAGFSSELSGRENVFLNGAVLGMTRRETKSKFDAIVEFAGVRDFIDMPVKHYSSGMAMRLGFSIAVHTEPDVLLVDEVLAVGDAEFRRKCVVEIGKLRRQGCALIFVSHNAPLVVKTCTRAMLLAGGGPPSLGSPRDVVGEYVRLSISSEAGSNGPHAAAPEAQVLSVRCLDSQGQDAALVDSGGEYSFEATVRSGRAIEEAVVGIIVHTPEGTEAYETNTRKAGADIGRLEAGDVARVSFTQEVRLLPGRYFVLFAVADLSRDGRRLAQGHCAFEVVGEQLSTGVCDLDPRVEIERLQEDGERRKARS